MNARQQGVGGKGGEQRDLVGGDAAVIAFVDALEAKRSGKRRVLLQVQLKIVGGGFGRTAPVVIALQDGWPCLSGGTGRAPCGRLEHRRRRGATFEQVVDGVGEAHGVLGL